MSQNFFVLGILVLVVLSGSAICSCVEAALLAVNPIRVYELAKNSNPQKSAAILVKLKKKIGRTLTVITIMNNGFNIFGSVMLGSYAAFVLKDIISLPFFSIILTTLILLLGEILPKSIGTRFALKIGLASAPLLQLIGFIMRPLVLLLEKLLPVITEESEITTNEEEIRQMATLGSQKGKIEEDEAAMISKVFQLNDLTARDLMTPRVAAPTIDGAKKLEDLRSEIIKNNDLWLVVLGEEVDKILGVISREKLLTELLNGNLKVKPSEICESVEYVPEMIRIDRLLSSFDKDKKSLRIVVDEFGGFVGVIGAEAVLAVLAGWWGKSNS